MDGRRNSNDDRDIYPGMVSFQGSDLEVQGFEACGSDRLRP